MRTTLLKSLYYITHSLRPAYKMPPFFLPTSSHISASSVPPNPHSKYHQINLLRGWPSPSLLPSTQLKHAAGRALSNPDVFIPGLLYGPDPGFQPLREHIAVWLEKFYGGATKGLPVSFRDERFVPSNGEVKIEDQDPAEFPVVEPESTPESTAASEPAPQGEAATKSKLGDNITITGGASQNLANVLLVYSDPVKTKVWIVAPCYFMACGIFEDVGCGMAAVGDGEGGGVDLVSLERGMREWGEEGRESLKPPAPWAKHYTNIIYCVPTFSNPSGLTMSLSTRISLVQLARKYDALIITDDVYDFLQWPASPTPSTPTPKLTQATLPRLIDIDRTHSNSSSSFGNAVSNGSFSKIAGPGVRTGWSDSTPTFAYGLSQCGASKSGGAPSHLTATIMDELLSSGDLDMHIEEVLKPSYERRWRIMVQAIQEFLVPLGVRMLGEENEGRGVVGGYFIWVDLPEGVDAEVVSERCKERENLVVPPGRLFEVRGDESLKFPGSIRLCFAWEEEVDLRDGVERLGRVVKAVLDGKIEDGGGGEKITKGDFGEFK